MEELANKRADNMIEARKRHFEDLLLKKNFYAQKQEMEDKQREVNLKRRKETYNMIQQRKIESIVQNLGSKIELKEKIHKDKQLEARRQMKELEEKKVQKLQELIHHNNIKRMQEAQLIEKQQNSFASYSVRQEENNFKRNAYKSRI